MNVLCKIGIQLGFAMILIRPFATGMTCAPQSV
jgi:hypothetical protein